MNFSNHCKEIELDDLKECVLPHPEQPSFVIAERAFDLLKRIDDKNSCWSCRHAVFEGTHMFCKNEQNYDEWVRNPRITNGVCPCDYRGKCDRFEK